MVKVWKQLVFLFLLSGFVLMAPLGVIAEESAVEEENQQKADQLRKEVEAILAETDDQESDRLMVKRAFCGNLVAHEKDLQELTIAVRDQEKIGQYDDNTVMIGISREPIEPQDMETGNYMVAMGYLNRLSPDKLQIKRLVVQETPTPITRESFFGQVGDISSEEKVFVLNQGEVVYEVLASKAILGYQDKDGKNITGKFEQLEEQDKVVIIGQRKDDNGRIEASKIHIVASALADL